MNYKVEKRGGYTEIVINGVSGRSDKKRLIQALQVCEPVADKIASHQHGFLDEFQVDACGSELRLTLIAKKGRQFDIDEVEKRLASVNCQGETA